MPPGVRRSAAQTREVLLDAAEELFYWRGIHASGVDAVAAAAGVAPTTLYRLFRSKDGLVTAYVERAADRYRARWEAVLARSAPDPRARILALFEALESETDPANCRGCLFLLAVAEIPDPDDPAHAAVRVIKDWTRSTFTELAAALVSDPDAAAVLGEELALVIDGVYGSVQTRRSTEPARRARHLAQKLLDVERR